MRTPKFKVGETVRLGAADKSPFPYPYDEWLRRGRLVTITGVTRDKSGDLLYSIANRWSKPLVWLPAKYFRKIDVVDRVRVPRKGAVNGEV